MHTKSRALPTRADYPTELTDRPQWLVWRYVNKTPGKKPSKIPYYVNGQLRGWPNGRPHGGKPTESQPQHQQGAPEDRAELVDFDAAHAAARTGGYDGVGLAFLPGDGLIGIDLDKVVGYDDERDDLGRSLVTDCNTFAELSPSRTGLHIIGRGDLRTFKSNDIGVEVFCGAQFFTMPGEHHPDSPFEINDIPPEVLARLLELVDAAKEARKAATPPAPPAPPMRPAASGGSRYAEAAFASAVQAVRTQGEGGRNDALNREAFGLGQLVGAGLLAEHEVHAALHDAGLACGLGVSEVASSLRSGLEAGKRSPRVLEQRAAPTAVAPTARAAADAPEWVDGETGEIYGGDDVAGAARPPAKQRSAPASAVMGEFPDMTPRGKPKATIANTQAALARLGVTVRYNLIRKDIEILIPGEAFTVDNRDNAALAWLMSEFTKLDIPTEKLGDYLLYIADRNQYNPVAVWVQSRPWDGVSRLQSLLDTITAGGEDKSRDVRALKEAMMRRWLLSCIAAAFEPDDAQLGGVLVLQGPQAIGKTAWFKSLVPASLKLIQDGLSLRVEDKDSVKQVISYWMVELGELDGTFRKTDIAQLKAFITRDKDTIRRAYARTESTYRRRTVFFASVNNEHFLQDDTGNRRYWTVAAEKINYSHGLDMQQVWAEVYADHYLKGQKWWLAPTEAALLHASNTKHEALDPVRERLSTQFCWGADGGQWRWITTTDALIEAGIVRPTRSDLAIGGPALRELNGGKVKAGRARTTYYLVPPAVSRL